VIRPTNRVEAVAKPRDSEGGRLIVHVSRFEERSLHADPATAKKTMIDVAARRGRLFGSAGGRSGNLTDLIH
jgi:hypothetical protein